MDTPGSSETRDARAILNRVINTYAGMTTYVSDVEIIHEGDIMGKPSRATGKGTMTLKKPDLYKIMLEEKWRIGDRVTAQTSTVVWSGGEGPHLYLSDRNAYARVKEDPFAFQIAHTAASVHRVDIPLFFFDFMRDMNSFLVNRDDMQGLRLLADDPVEGQTCYVLEGDLTGLYFRLFLRICG